MKTQTTTTRDHLGAAIPSTLAIAAVIVATLVCTSHGQSQQQQVRQAAQQPAPNQPVNAPAIEAVEAPVAAAVERPDDQDMIQIAILLDTSGSMSGLIEQAKTHLWSIINQSATTRRNGKIPTIQVALLHYGNDSLPSSEGYIEMLTPLTGDLDTVSEKLFALKTNGGSEYCGHVIDKAVKSLGWSTSNKAYKAIFIAGNEPFTQGSVDYKKACAEAIANGIIVNTIHCGNEKAGIDGKWQHGAELADGSFFTIDHNRVVAHIDAPQDTEISKLNAELNTTYIAYGKRGQQAAARQTAQDANASTVAPSVVAERAKTKSGAAYKNADWDLVDAVKDDKLELAEVETEALPEEMQKMTEQERKEHVEKMAKRRAELQAKLRKLVDARDKYVAGKRKEAAAAGEGDTLGHAINKAVTEQVKSRGFETEAEAQKPTEAATEESAEQTTEQ